MPCLMCQTCRESILFLQNSAAEKESELRAHDSQHRNVLSESGSRMLHLNAAFEASQAFKHASY